MSPLESPHQAREGCGESRMFRRQREKVGKDTGAGEEGHNERKSGTGA